MVAEENKNESRLGKLKQRASCKIGLIQLRFILSKVGIGSDQDQSKAASKRKRKELRDQVYIQIVTFEKA